MAVEFWAQSKVGKKVDKVCCPLGLPKPLLRCFSPAWGWAILWAILGRKEKWHSIVLNGLAITHITHGKWIHNASSKRKETSEYSSSAALFESSLAAKYAAPFTIRPAYRVKLGDCSNGISIAQVMEQPTRPVTQHKKKPSFTILNGLALGLRDRQDQISVRYPMHAGLVIRGASSSRARPLGKSFDWLTLAKPRLNATIA